MNDHEPQNYVKEGRSGEDAGQKECSARELEKSTCEREARKAKEADYQRRYFLKHRERNRINCAAYRAKHKKRMNDAARLDRKNNPEKYKSYATKFRSKNIERARHMDRLRYERDKKRIRERNNSYAKKNPAAAIRRTNNRNARITGATVGHEGLIQKWHETWRKKKTATCYWCQKSLPAKRCHSDHIVALAKGGLHSIENLCVSCATCNLRKQAQYFGVWNKRLSQPVLEL